LSLPNTTEALSTVTTTVSGAGGSVGEEHTIRTGDMRRWLMVEDSPSGSYLVERALREAALPVQLHVVPNGDHALSFLRREEPYATGPHPDLVLLTIYLASKNGREVLAEIKQDPRLKRIPVVMWSVSAQQYDVDLSYELGANAYVRKPVSLAEHCAIVKRMFDFWCRDVLLPTTA
jgi:CheY-like chemotaxis protein